MGKLVLDFSKHNKVVIPISDERLIEIALRMLKEHNPEIEIYKKNGIVAKPLIPKVLKDYEKKMPTSKKVEKFILEQQKFRHGFSSVSEHFTGIKLVNVRKQKDLYNKIYRRVTTARNRIQVRHNGRWKEVKDTSKGETSTLWKPKTWEFVKNV